MNDLTTIIIILALIIVFEFTIGAPKLTYIESTNFRDKLYDDTLDMLSDGATYGEVADEYGGTWVWNGERFMKVSTKLYSLNESDEFTLNAFPIQQCLWMFDYLLHFNSYPQYISLVVNLFNSFLKHIIII